MLPISTLYPMSMPKHIYLVYTGEAPFHTSVDGVGGYQGAHYKRRKAIRIATQIHQRIRDMGIQKALTLVIRSPAGVWTDGLFNLKHFYKGADRDTTPHMVVHSLYVDQPAVDDPPTWALLQPDRRLPNILHSFRTSPFSVITSARDSCETLLCDFFYGSR